MLVFSRSAAAGQPAILLTSTSAPDNAVLSHVQKIPRCRFREVRLLQSRR
jgi:hypothetical protein